VGKSFSNRESFFVIRYQSAAKQPFKTAYRAQFLNSSFIIHHSSLSFPPSSFINHHYLFPLPGCTGRACPAPTPNQNPTNDRRFVGACSNHAHVPQARQINNGVQRHKFPLSVFRYPLSVGCEAAV